MTESAETNDDPGTPSAPGADSVFQFGRQRGTPNDSALPVPAAWPVDGDSSLSGPVGLRRLDTVAELSAFRDGTVVIWHSSDGLNYQRQAGVLDTSWGGERKVRPVTLRIVEFDTDLDELEPPLWVLTFNDPDNPSK